MINPLLHRLDMAVEHRAGTAAAHRVPDSVCIEPFLSGFLPTTDFVAYTGLENLGPTTGDRSEPRLSQDRERFAERQAKDPVGKVPDLNGCESFNVKLRIKGTKCAQ